MGTRRGGRTSAKRHKRIIEESGLACFWCDCPIQTRQKGRANSATIDHIIPLSSGGSDGAGNKVASCSRCNYIKGSRAMGDWLPRLGRHLQRIGRPHHLGTVLQKLAKAGIWPKSANPNPAPMTDTSAPEGQDPAPQG